LDDSKIIELYFQRDQQAIAETDEKYGRLLRSVAKNILGSDVDTEECISDTLMRLWDTIPPKQPPSLMAYCAKITRNLALNKLKYITADKRGAGNYGAVLDDLKDVLPSDENVEKTLDRKVLCELIDRFLGELKKESRIIFVKRYWHFESVDEISRELGISRTKVTTSLHRTRQKLKEYLEKEGYDI